MNIIAATLDSTVLAAQSIIFNINGNIWIFTAFGISTSLSILVGNAMGAGKINLAKKLSREMLLIFLTFSVFVMFMFILFARSILRIFTSDEAIVEQGLPAYYIMTLVIPLDTLNWIAIGILKGLGRIRYLPFFEIVFDYFLMQPLCYYFCIVKHYDFEVYWIGLVGAVASIMLCNYFYLYTLNWDKIAKEIKSRSEDACSSLKLDSELDEKLLIS